MGDYHPEGVLPQVADPEQDGGSPGIYPAFVSEKVVMVDHHALFMDTVTMDLRIMPAPVTFKIYSLTAEDWSERDAVIKASPLFQNLLKLMEQEDNITRQHHLLNKLLQKAFKDRLQRAGDGRD